MPFTTNPNYSLQVLVNCLHTLKRAKKFLTDEIF